MGQILNYRQRISGPLLDRIDMTLEVARLPIEKLASDDEGGGEMSQSIKARVMAARQRQYERNLAVPARHLAPEAESPPPGAESSAPAGLPDPAARPDHANDVTTPPDGLDTGSKAPGARSIQPSDAGTAGAEHSAVSPECQDQLFLDDTTGAVLRSSVAATSDIYGYSDATGGYKHSGADSVPAVYGDTNAALSARQVKKYCKLNDACQELLLRAAERLGLSARAYERIRKVARTIADLEGSENIEVPHLAEAIQYRSGEERLRG